MSEVNFLQCVICNPEFKDIPTRRTVVATSQELGALVTHIIKEHVQVKQPELPGKVENLREQVEQILASQAEISLRLEFLETLAKENSPKSAGTNVAPPPFGLLERK
jgi:hypothetical protein